MDLKRAWRNGFLAPLLLALPLYDLSLGEYRNRIAGDNAQIPSAAHITEASTRADVGAGNPDAARENPLEIPAHVLTSMLLGSSRSNISDNNELALHFDPQDIFDSDGGSGDGFPEPTEDIQRIADMRRRSGAPLSIGFAGPIAAAGSHGAPFSLGLFTAGGNSGSDGATGNSAEDTAAPLLSDPSSGEQSQPDSTLPDDFDHGTENGWHQTVPEPSSLVLLAIGAIAVASLLPRNSKTTASRS